MKTLATLVLAVALIVSAGALVQASASVPQLLNYQGKLLQASGVPVADGSYQVTFSLWQNPTSKAPADLLWSETHASVQTKTGLFAVLLGGVTPLPAGIFSGSDVYLGLKVGGDTEMTPRQQIASAPFAFRAATAATVDDGAVTSAKLMDGAVTTDKIADGVVTGAKIASGAVDSTKVTLTSGDQRCDSAVTVSSSSPVVIPGASRGVQVTVPSRVAIVATFDIDASTGAGAGVFIGELTVDGTAQACKAALQCDGDRGTISQSWLISLSPGYHVLQLRGSRYSGTGGAEYGRVNTGFTWILFSQ